MATAIIGIGLPGSGKTTLLKALATSMEATYIAPDDIRAELSGSASTQSMNTEVWTLAYERLESALEAGHDVIVDATHYKREDRSRIIEFCRRWPGVKVSGLWVITPYNVCQERNLQRERVVPEHAMMRMHKAFCDTPPSKGEGFDTFFPHFSSR